MRLSPTPIIGFSFLVLRGGLTTPEGTGVHFRSQLYLSALPLPWISLMNLSVVDLEVRGTFKGRSQGWLSPVSQMLELQEGPLP